MRLPLFDNVFMRFGLEKGFSMCLGFNYTNTGDFWVFSIYLLPFNIQIYSGIEVG